MTEHLWVWKDLFKMKVLPSLAIFSIFSIMTLYFVTLNSHLEATEGSSQRIVLRGCAGERHITLPGARVCHAVTTFPQRYTGTSRSVPR